MPCYRPLKGYFAKELTAAGKRPVVFNKREGYYDLPVEVPCGQCTGCKLERSRQWAIRATHEASLHSENSFITLTYDDAHLPWDRSLDVREWQLFMKRLRKQYGAGIRFLHCGEYGDQLGRPHYHACLFNHEFGDEELWKMVEGERLYTSESLTKLWGNGFCTVGSVSFQSAAYVARYSLKKKTGKIAEAHYQGRTPEYLTSSKAPGIGLDWLKKFYKDVFPRDLVIINGVRVSPPQYYFRQLQEICPDTYRAVRQSRMEGNLFQNRDWHERGEKRLRVKEIVTDDRMTRLVRTLEKEAVQ